MVSGSSTINSVLAELSVAFEELAYLTRDGMRRRNDFEAPLSSDVNHIREPPMFPPIPEGWDDWQIVPDFSFPKDWIYMSDIPNLHKYIETVPTPHPCVAFLKEAMLECVSFTQMQLVLRHFYQGKGSVRYFVGLLETYIPELKDMYYHFQDEHGIYVVRKSVVHEGIHRAATKAEECSDDESSHED